ncbi:transmembrane protein 88B [Symphalangus syndactylus]|uniref:transmembrane protein 88B n=1 Tax=Symphalangus syndactylus TaxID=9590 RepID=UPI0024413537|nr:transmembrane protein 88B [Symphalangus syndactylus]
MSEQGRETEEEEGGGGASDTAPMLPRGPLDHQASALTCPGWSGPLLLPGRLLAGLLLHLLLPAAAFLLVLLPAAAVVYLGFLCHSRVHPAPGPRCRALFSDRGSAALIVFGLLSLPPLLVLASAVRARLARRLRPLLPPPAGTPGPRRPPGRPDGDEQLCAWV